MFFLKQCHCYRFGWTEKDNEIQVLENESDLLFLNHETELFRLPFYYDNYLDSHAKKKDVFGLHGFMLVRRKLII